MELYKRIKISDNSKLQYFYLYFILSQTAINTL
jgi:hypothetical protein